MSKGEKKDTGKARQYILANTMEAIIGALYLDQGYEPSKKFITKKEGEEEEEKEGEEGEEEEETY